jgi:hypothetical protein
MFYNVTLPNNQPQTAPDQGFSIEDWLVGPAAQDQLDEMKSTHIVNPLLAMDVHGRLIKPQDYL